MWKIIGSKPFIHIFLVSFSSENETPCFVDNFCRLDLVFEKLRNNNTTSNVPDDVESLLLSYPSTLGFDEFKFVTNVVPYPWENIGKFEKKSECIQLHFASNIFVEFFLIGKACFRIHWLPTGWLGSIW